MLVKNSRAIAEPGMMGKRTAGMTSWFAYTTGICQLQSSITGIVAIRLVIQPGPRGDYNAATA